MAPQLQRSDGRAIEQSRTSAMAVGHACGFEPQVTETAGLHA